MRETCTTALFTPTRTSRDIGLVKMTEFFKWEDVKAELFTEEDLEEIEKRAFLMLEGLDIVDGY